VPPTPPPPPGTSTDPKNGVLDRFTDWLGSVLNDIVRALADPVAGQVLLSEQGLDVPPPALPASLLGRLDQEMQAGTDPTAKAAESFGDVLVAIAALTEAIVAAAGEHMTGTEVAELVADTLDLHMSLRLREDYPGLWAVARMLNLIVDDVAVLGNLNDLVTDSHRYLTGVANARNPVTGQVFEGPAYAQNSDVYSAAVLGTAGTAIAFLPPVPRYGATPHGHDATSLHIEVLYGWAPASVQDHPNLMEILSRVLTVRIDGQVKSTPSLPGAEQVVSLTFALVPAEHNQGHSGLFFRLSGATTMEIPFTEPDPSAPPPPPGQPPTTKPTGWQLTITTTDGGALEILFADNGFVRGVTTGYRASLALERPDDVSGSWVIGPKTGSHVEIQHARLAFTVSDDEQGWLGALTAQTDHLIVDLEIGSDSFLRAVLPPSVRIDTKLGAGWDNRKGFYLDGGVTLVVDLPVHATLGSASVFALLIQGLHLRIGLTSADAGGDGRSGASFTVALTVDAAVTIGGVFTASVAGVGAAYALKQVQASPATDGAATAGHWQPTLSGVPPSGLGLLIKSTMVTGGGFIGHDPQSGAYSGVLQLKAGVWGVSWGVTALGRLDTKIPDHEGDWALLLILAVTFSPGLSVGGGVQFTGLGGVYGHNHTVDSDAIAAGLRTKALDAILFPPDPVVQAPHIFDVWRQTMPVADGHTTVGLMGQLTWGGESLSTLELAVLLGPDEVVLLASLQLHAPSKDAPLVRFRADAVGRLRFDPPDFLLQAELVDARISGYPLAGGLVLMLRGGSDSAYLLSVGGFNPHFTPPANVPSADRLRIDLSSGNNPRLRMEAYLAITSQTLQLGARAQLHASAGPLAVDGWLAFDGLVAWLPCFGLSLEIAAGLSMSLDGSPLMEVNLDILLEGPGPWHIHGYASLSLLFYTLSLPIDHSFGDPNNVCTSQVVQAIDLVRDALSSPDAWSAPPPGASALIVVRPPRGPALPAHPLAVVSCRQRVAPLGLQITHVGNQSLAAPTTVDVTGLTLGGSAAADAAPVDEGFAAGQFLDLSDDEKLSRPSFEPMRAGLATGGGEVDAGNATVVATTYKTVAVDGATRTTRPPWLLDLVHANAVLRPQPPATARPAPAQLTVLADTLRTVTGDPAGPVTASLASQRAGSQRLLDLAGMAGAPS
jgi:Family of unknown function (DUF6603)